MPGPHPTRRQVLQALGFAAAASKTAGFSRWCYAFAEESSPPKATPPYRPLFFTAPEYTLVETLAELILPGASKAAASDGAPTRPEDAGATDAGVAEFIDFMIASDPATQAPFRRGLAWMNTASPPNGFVALTSEKQRAVLDRLAYRKNFLVQEQEAQTFFAEFRKLTVMGFYTSRIGLESLDYPGLRFYKESPSVPQDAFLRSLEL